MENVRKAQKSHRKISINGENPQITLTKMLLNGIILLEKHVTYCIDLQKRYKYVS